MNQAVKVAWESLRSVAFGAIGAGYGVVGTPFSNPARIIVMQNFTNVQVSISDDGVNDKWVLPAGGQMIIDYMANRSDVTGFLEEAAGTQLYVKATSALPTSGNFYVSVGYGKAM